MKVPVDEKIYGKDAPTPDEKAITLLRSGTGTTEGAAAEPS